MILTSYQKFLDKIFKHINRLNIDVSQFEMDHLGYSISSSTEYDKLRPEFSKLGALVKENIIGGRRVGVCKLYKKLLYKDFSISALEFMEPKKGELTKTGLEHAEFIVNLPLEKFMTQYPSLPWDTSHITRNQFPRLKLVLEKGLEIKFHRTSVLEE